MLVKFAAGVSTLWRDTSAGERLQLRVFPRKIQAAEAGGWLGANAKNLRSRQKRRAVVRRAEQGV